MLPSNGEYGAEITVLLAQEQLRKVSLVLWQFNQQAWCICFWKVYTFYFARQLEWNKRKRRNGKQIQKKGKTKTKFFCIPLGGGRKSEFVLKLLFGTVQFWFVSFSRSFSVFVLNLVLLDTESTANKQPVINVTVSWEVIFLNPLRVR